jgi:hypothetical protein
MLGSVRVAADRGNEFGAIVQAFVLEEVPSGASVSSA